MTAIRINQSVGPDGLIKAGDVFTLKSDGLYHSNRIPAQAFTAEYVSAHMNGRRLTYVSAKGEQISKFPHGYPKMFTRI